MEATAAQQTSGLRAAQPVQHVPVNQALAASPRQMTNPLGGVNVREMTTATLGAIEGAPGSWGSVLLGTALRAGLIGGVLYFYPKSSKKVGTILGQSLVASTVVTVMLLAAHGIIKRI